MTIQALIDSGWRYEKKYQKLQGVIEKKFSISFNEDKPSYLRGSIYRYSVYLNDDLTAKSFQNNIGNGDVNEEDKEWLLSHFKIKR